MPPQSTLHKLTHNGIDLLTEFGPNALAAIIVLVIGWFVARAVVRGFDKGTRKLDLDPPLRTLIARILRLVVMALFALLALDNLGVDLLPLIAGLGVLGAGIALALQGVLGNMVAGLTILLTRPFRVGEYIEILTEGGRIEAITLFNTRLAHPDRSVVVIPNRKIVGEILHNFGSVRQLAVTVGVAYDTDLSRALRVIDEVLAANAKLLKDPAPVVRVVAFADSSVNIAIRPWAPITEAGVAAHEVHCAILERFRASGIQIPFPQREVRMLGSTPA
ncbi:MAG: mechanosensitive ion channel family protein [Phycisphaerales bacterium]